MTSTAAPPAAPVQWSDPRFAIIQSQFECSSVKMLDDEPMRLAVKRSNEVANLCLTYLETTFQSIPAFVNFFKEAERIEMLAGQPFIIRNVTEISTNKDEPPIPTDPLEGALRQFLTIPQQIIPILGKRLICIPKTPRCSVTRTLFQAYCLHFICDWSLKVYPDYIELRLTDLIRTMRAVKMKKVVFDRLKTITIWGLTSAEQQSIFNDKNPLKRMKAVFQSRAPAGMRFCCRIEGTPMIRESQSQKGDLFGIEMVGAQSTFSLSRRRAEISEIEVPQPAPSSQVATSKK